MKRAGSVLLAALLVGGLASSPAFGVTSHHKKPWQAVSGHFKTKRAASTRIRKLAAKGFSGYRIETEKRGQFAHGRKYEVEKGYATQKKAKAAVAKLHKAGFKASVEQEKTER